MRRVCPYHSPPNPREPLKGKMTDPQPPAPDRDTSTAGRRHHDHRPRRCRPGCRFQTRPELPQQCQIGRCTAQEVVRWQCATATREAGYGVQKGSEGPFVRLALRPWMRREVAAGASTTHRPDRPAPPARPSHCGSRPGHQYPGVPGDVTPARCGAPRFRWSRRRYGHGSRRGFQ